MPRRKKSGEGSNPSPDTSGDPVARSDKDKTGAFAPYEESEQTKKRREKKWAGMSRKEVRDVTVKSIGGKLQKLFGHSKAILVDDLKSLNIVMPVPAWSFEYLTQLNGMPLSNLIQVVGPTSVGKTTFVLELGRWFQLQDGVFVYVDNDHKLSDTLVKGVLKDHWDELIPLRSSNLEEWQSMVTKIYKAAKAEMMGTAKDPGRGATYPVLVVVDGIMAKMSEDTIKKTEEKGHSWLDFPKEANLMTRYIKALMPQMEGWPFTSVYVNQMKFDADKYGNPQRRVAGGRQIDFQKLLDIEVKMQKKKIESEEWDGYQVELRCEKNSLAPAFRKIQTRVKWRYYMEGGEKKQDIWWDWGWSNVHTIVNAREKYKKALKEADFHLAVGKSSEIQDSCWSRTLGVTEKDQVSWSEMGNMIQSRPDVLEILRDAFDIHREAVMTGDYIRQKEELKQQAD